MQISLVLKTQPFGNILVTIRAINDSKIVFITANKCGSNKYKKTRDFTKKTPASYCIRDNNA